MLMNYNSERRPQLEITAGTDSMLKNSSIMSASGQVVKDCNFSDVNRTVFSLVKADTSDLCLDSGEEQDIPARDICFARKSGGRWACVHSDQERLTWDFNASYGPPVSWMKGKIDRCDGSSYAFVHIVLPPPLLPLVSPFDWWAAYGPTFLGVSIPLALLLVLVALCVWKGLRDRKQYKTEKAVLDGLVDETQRVAEYEGGLAPADADGDIEMVANPMIIQMEELKRHFASVKEQMGMQEVNDEARMAELEAERNAIRAEMEALQNKIDEQNKSQRTQRVVQDEAPPPVAAVGAGAARGQAGAAPAQSVFKPPKAGGMQRGPTKKKILN